MQFTREVLRLNQYFREKRSRYLEPYGLKGYHAWFLIELNKHPGISQDGLSQKQKLDKSTVARRAAFLEEAGYLKRESDPSDKRTLRLYPTEKALSLAAPLEKEAQQWEEDLLQALTPEERAQLTNLLERLLTATERREQG